MKQHITPVQLEELSEKSAERLRDWQISKQYAFEVWDSVEKKRKKGKVTFLSIGQMIEFLDDKLSAMRNEVYYTKREGNGPWSVLGNFSSEQQKNVQPELCDALWEAVKEVLKTDK